jgi:hypothetical protein
MAIVDEVIRILTCQAVRRISFSFQTVTASTITVNATTFQRVADKIRSGTVHVTDDLSQLLSQEDTAEYSPRRNLLIVRPTHNFRANEAVVVHESVHASLDLTRSTIPRVDNEIAAFIAEAFFLRRTGYPYSRYSGDWAESAMPVVNSVLRTGTASSAHIRRLRTAILNDPVYNSDAHQGCGSGSTSTTCNGTWFMDVGNG